MNAVPPKGIRTTIPMVKTVAILYEGVPVFSDNSVTFPEPLDAEDWVVPDNHKENTYEATWGMAVVKKHEGEQISVALNIPNNGQIMVFLGQIISYPAIVRIPLNKKKEVIKMLSWEQCLKERFYRTATIQWMIGQMED